MILSKQSMLLSKRLIEKGHATESVSQMSIEQKMEQLGESKMTAVIVWRILRICRELCGWLIIWCQTTLSWVFVESRTDLDEEALQNQWSVKSDHLCGSNWLSNQMGTRNPAKVGELADNAYWGKNSVSNKEINNSLKTWKSKQVLLNRLSNLSCQSSGVKPVSLIFVKFRVPWSLSRARLVGKIFSSRDWLYIWRWF